MPSEHHGTDRSSSTTPPVTSHPPESGDAGEHTELPVVVDGAVVGAVALTFPGGSLTAADRHTRTLLLTRVWLASTLAIALAVVIAAFVSQRITRPVRQLATAAANVEQGRAPPALPSRAPGELGVLARGFASMLATIRRQDLARRTLAADVAHELRTPLTVLRAQSEELLEGIRPPTPERLSSLHDEVLRVTRIVDDLAILAAADVDALRLQRQPLDLATVAGEVVESMKPVFDDAELLVESDFAPVTVNADGDRLAQVLSNLLTNAAKFTAAGGWIKVTTRRAGDRAELIVADSGAGIDADEMAHVFERFWRGRRSAGVGGSGVGLAVVKQLVEAHGGTVTVESRTGTGSVFTVSLPITPTHPGDRLRSGMGT